MRERWVDGDVNVMSEHPNSIWDYLTLYGPKGEILCRSVGFEKEQEAYVTYRGVLFIASPGYADSVVVVEWDSLINYINEGAK